MGFYCSGKFYFYNYGPDSLGTIILVHLSKQKLKVMKYKLSVLNERVEFLVKELKEKVSVIEADENFTEVEITINEDMDILRVFHAGVNNGIAVMHT